VLEVKLDKKQIALTMRSERPAIAQAPGDRSRPTGDRPRPAGGRPSPEPQRPVSRPATPFNNPFAAALAKTDKSPPR